MCKCCSFDSLSCRRRTLKTCGAFLILFGFVFFLAGIAVGILPRVYAELPDVYSTYIFFAFLVPATGMAALVTGMGSIHMGRVMSDDDCSARGVSALALLTILCSLASVGVPAWPLYEEGYFLGIPPQTQAAMNNTTAGMTTAAPLQTSMLPAMTTSASLDNSTSLANSTASSDNATQIPTSSNVTMAPQVMTTLSAANSTQDNSTQDNSTQTDAMSTAAPDNATSAMSQNDTAPSTAVPTTGAATGGTNEPTVTSNSTEQTTAATREPIPFEQWFDVIVPFGIICVFALIFVLCALLVCCIGCCCSDYSEIVDDNDIYKR